MSVYYLAGARANILRDVVFTPSDEDALFTAADFLADGEPSTVFKFATAAANSGVVADLGTLLKNGDFEDAPVSGLPPDWLDQSTGDGVIVVSTAIFDSGAQSLKFTTETGGDTATAVQDIVVQAGCGMSITAALRRDDAGTIVIRVQNLDTGKYLDSSEAWQTAASDWYSRTATPFATKGPNTFTVEAASVAERAVYTLRVTVELTGTEATGYVDSFFIWHHWDIAAILGAEYPPTVTARIRSDSAVGMPSPTNQVAFPFGRPTVWGEPASTVTEQFLQLYFDGTPLRPEKVGELLAGCKRTLPNVLLQPVPMATTAMFSPIGDGRDAPVSIERDSSRNFRLSTLALGETQFAQIRREFCDPLGWGGGQLFIVPDSTKQGEAFYGWVDRITELDLGKSCYRIETDFHGHAFSVRTT
ncbi:MAG: hypothetical protein V3U85_10255 [Hyphomicrobium sp.]